MAAAKRAPGANRRPQGGTSEAPKPDRSTRHSLSDRVLADTLHLIRQPVALLFLSALSKSLLLVAINSRQLTNSMLVFTPGGILSEYEFRSRHSTSQLSTPNAVPLNNVRITRSHFSLLPCSRYVSAAFRSSSLSARRPWLASFCAGACDEARTHTRITNSRRVINAVSGTETYKAAPGQEGRSFVSV
jgi:hypothetical protein